MSDYSERGKKSWKTRRINSAWVKVHASEAASKEALKSYLEKRGWRVVFFEGKTGAPRTGIIDAVAYRLDRKNADQLDVKLIQQRRQCWNYRRRDPTDKASGQRCESQLGAGRFRREHIAACP